MSTERPELSPGKDPGSDSPHTSDTATADGPFVAGTTLHQSLPTPDASRVIALNVGEARGALVRREEALSSPVVRANLYFVLARAFGPPQRWPKSFWSLIELATGRLSAPFQRAGFGMIEALHETDPEVHIRAHTALFVGPFTVLAPPWASFYLDPEQRIGGPYADPIRDAFGKLGLKPAEGWPEPPDHVAYLFELLYVVAFKSAQGEDATPITEEFVWATFLHPWLPRFLGLLRAAAADRSRFYASVGDLAEALLIARTHASSQRAPSAQHEQASMP